MPIQNRVVGPEKADEVYAYSGPTERGEQAYVVVPAIRRQQGLPTPAKALTQVRQRTGQAVARTFPRRVQGRYRSRPAQTRDPPKSDGQVPAGEVDGGGDHRDRGRRGRAQRHGHGHRTRTLRVGQAPPATRPWDAAARNGGASLSPTRRPTTPWPAWTRSYQPTTASRSPSSTCRSAAARSGAKVGLPPMSKPRSRRTWTSTARQARRPSDHRRRPRAPPDRARKAAQVLMLQYGSARLVDVDKPPRTRPRTPPPDPAPAR